MLNFKNLVILFCFLVGFGIGFYFKENYVPNVHSEGINLHRLLISEISIEGDFVYRGSGKAVPFTALKNLNFDEVY